MTLNDLRFNYIFSSKGNWSNGIWEGEGKTYDEAGLTGSYEGTYRAGRPSGKGISYHNNGTKNYEGEYLDGKKHGHGVFYWPPSSIGSSINSNETSPAKRYEGEVRNGKPHGMGVMYAPDGTVVARGEFENGALKSDSASGTSSSASSITSIAHAPAEAAHNASQQLTPPFPALPLFLPETTSNNTSVFTSVSSMASAPAQHAPNQPTPPFPAVSPFVAKSNNNNTWGVSFSVTLTRDSPIMSAPLDGIFPRYEDAPARLLQGGDFSELEDDEVPTPINLQEEKTRADWMAWVRKFYPRKGTSNADTMDVSDE